MKKTFTRPNREAVAYALFALERQFGKRPLEKEIAPLAGKGEIGIELPEHIATARGKVQGGAQ